jgi:CubicO group peptidase (beta-lactamase class C family)
VDQGLIKNVTDKVGQYVWDESFEGEHNLKVTWDHLLTQSSDWSGSLFGLQDWADRPPKEGSMDDWKNRKLLEPGTNYEYNDVRVNLLAYSLLQVWRKPLPLVLKEKIMDPIGASSTWRWFGYENSFVNMDGLMMQSVSGGGHHGGGIFINTLDHARFGLLFLRNGKWKNQQLLSEKWINAAQQPSAANKNYGYLWWLNTGQEWKGISQKVYYAAGYGGNYIIVDKEHDLVVVTRWMDDTKIADVLRLIIQSIDGK